MPHPLPADRETVAALTDSELDALAAALATAHTLVDDVRDERAPQSHCGRWDHPGHHWTRHGRTRYCWGNGPSSDLDAYEKCGATWPHPAHNMAAHHTPCPGQPTTT
ncbi:hypothetical protein WKI65_44185 [Streptomyces sp. MS1.AVA.3]|uniref:hypothetical protein n=1 Tax=Streptomyces decoyicus TaxID=249567 RepID=UPI0030C5DE38